MHCSKCKIFYKKTVKSLCDAGVCMYSYTLLPSNSTSKTYFEEIKPLGGVNDLIMYENINNIYF